MPKTKHGGLGGVDAFFNSPKKSAEEKPNGARSSARKPKRSTPRTRPEETEKLTVHIPKRQIAGLEKLKAAQRAQGKRRRDATITGLVIEAIDLLLAKRK